MEIGYYGKDGKLLRTVEVQRTAGGFFFAAAGLHDSEVAFIAWVDRGVQVIRNAQELPQQHTKST